MGHQRSNLKRCKIGVISRGLIYYSPKKIPTWIFHSFDDPYVLYTTSNTSFDNLTGVSDVMKNYPHENGISSNPASGDYTISYSQSLGLGPWTPGTVYPTGIITYTLYSSGGHDAWTRTFSNCDVWKWLYNQSR
jgi:predicted peptidase